MFVFLVNNPYNYQWKPCKSKEAWTTCLGRERHIVQGTVPLLIHNCWQKEVQKSPLEDWDSGGVSPQAPHHPPWPFAVLTSLLSPGAGGTCPLGTAHLCPGPASCPWLFLSYIITASLLRVQLCTCVSCPRLVYALSLVRCEATEGGRICTYSSRLSQKPWYWVSPCACSHSCIMDLANKWLHKFRHIGLHFVLK